MRGRIRTSRAAAIQARQLRSAATDAERRLWRRIRRRQVAGFKFRRQFPIDSYIVDFVCPEARLIVEVDGGQHTEQSAYDERRTEILGRHGYRVLRFWNNDVLTDADAVLQVIWDALQEPSAPPSRPSP